MTQPWTVTLKTLTPIWTGGVDQTCDRLHETGLIGSLRWWYEALIRALGGYACDPTSENPDSRCAFDTQAYVRAKAEGKSEKEAITVGLRTVCPVCYVFGTTGWARLFKLQTLSISTTSLHFCTTLEMNAAWLRRVFAGSAQHISQIRVPFGDLSFRVSLRPLGDEAYVKSQLALLLRLVADYGAIGARPQHGFGLFQVSNELDDIRLGINQLKARLEQGTLRSTGPAVNTPFDLKNYVGLTFHLTKDALQSFISDQAIVGSQSQTNPPPYLPCAFDLRYKGKNRLGFRRWLKEEKGWPLSELDLLLGSRSQWKVNGRERRGNKELRIASRVFFGMPYWSGQSYRLRVWGFWTSELSGRLHEPSQLAELIESYMKDAFNVSPTSKVYWEHIHSSLNREG